MEPAFRYGDARADGAIYGEAFYDMYRLAPPASAGGPWRYHVLYEFPLGPKAGAPAGKPIFDAAGNLFDTTETFGSHGAPTLFRLKPSAFPDAPWLLTTLAQLPNDHGHGAPYSAEQPNAAPVRGPFGMYYGCVGAGARPGDDGYVYAFQP